MIGSFLVTGGDFNERQEKAYEIIQKTVPDNQWKLENNPDYHLIDSEPSVGIEEIRWLQEKIKLKPFGHTIKVALIPKAEKITPEAQNAFLKTLEEPPEKTLIILCTPDPFFLLPTISSRCQIIQLPTKSQVVLSEDESQNYQRIFQKLISPSIGERFQIIEEEKLSTDRQQTLNWLEKMAFLIRLFLINQYLKKEPTIGLTSSELLSILKSLLKTKSYLQANVNIRLALEVFLLDLPLPTC